MLKALKRHYVYIIILLALIVCGFIFFNRDYIELKDYIQKKYGVDTVYLGRSKDKAILAVKIDGNTERFDVRRTKDPDNKYEDDAWDAIHQSELKLKIYEALGGPEPDRDVSIVKISTDTYTDSSFGNPSVEEYLDSNGKVYVELLISDFGIPEDRLKRLETIDDDIEQKLVDAGINAEVSTLSGRQVLIEYVTDKFRSMKEHETEE
jgi:hypothetical protein